MTNPVASVGRGLLSGYLTGEKIRRDQAAEDRQVRQDQRTEAQDARRAELDGLTIQNARNTQAEFEANAPLRESDRAAKLATAQDDEEARLNERSLFEADKQYRATGDLSGFKSVFSDADPNYELHDITADPKTGAVKVEIVDHRAGTIMPREFKSYDAMTSELAQFTSPAARKAAIAKAQAQQQKLDEEARQEQENVRSDQRKHANAVDLAHINNDARAGIAASRLQAIEEGRTGRIESAADRGKLILQTAKGLEDDPDYAGKSYAERITAAQGIVASLYPEGGSPAGAGLTHPAPGGAAPQPPAKPAPAPKADAGKPATFKTKSGATMSQEQYRAIVSKARAANPNADPQAVENAVRARYGFPSL